jgi:hypothetical protein
MERHVIQWLCQSYQFCLMVSDIFFFCFQIVGLCSEIILMLVKQRYAL